jgi:hypothetical protein
MTELETIEAVAILGSNALAAFTIYYSFTFAYLTVCYLVGTRLSRFQTAAISILYVISATSASLSVVGHQQAMTAIMETHPSVLNQITLWDLRLWGPGLIFLLVSGIFLSLYFLYDCRRRDNESIEKDT